MADSFVQLAADSTGKKIDTRTEGTNSEHRQVMVIGDPSTNAGVAPVDGTKGLAVDLSATGANSNKLLVTPDLPALAATSTKQSDGSQKTQIVDGSGNVVGSTSNALDINIKSGNPTSITANIGTTNGLALDATLTGGTQQTKITNGTTVADTLAGDSGQNTQLIAGARKEVAFTTTTVQAVASTDVSNYRWVSLYITSQGTSSTVTFQGSNDNSNWVSVPLSIEQSTLSFTTSTTAANQIWSGPLRYRYFRLNVTGISAGTTAGTIQFFTTAMTQHTSIVFPQGGSTEGAAASGNAVRVGGWDGTNIRTLKTNSTGNLLVDSMNATGAAVPANAFYNGVNAQTSLPTAATAGNLTGVTGDKFGRPVVLPGTIRDLVGTQTTTISASTSETTIVTAAASTFNDLTALIISNTSATSTRIDFRDTTAGSVLFSLYIPAGDMRGIAFNRPVPQTSVNTNWTAQSATSVTDLRVYAIWDKNK